MIYEWNPTRPCYPCVVETLEGCHPSHTATSGQARPPRGLTSSRALLHIPCIREIKCAGKDVMVLWSSGHRDTYSQTELLRLPPKALLRGTFFLILMPLFSSRCYIQHVPCIQIETHSSFEAVKLRTRVQICSGSPFFTEQLPSGHLISSRRVSRRHNLDTMVSSGLIEHDSLFME